ncbi:MAG: bacterial/archaeal transporter family-2 protein [Gaiellaceae bacterium]|nr:bacterial/archaeal transporter family-2 protein [Gaiellaceae bacterium]MDX6478823.1 bacterial/archaeal transporter family-2 protein [Gaiellaceae bacterium]MDX6482695.1 bacterial/archaeal transporter family-2 protein [Gaiellaceae bacterium]MDX6509895.1 bacterial/archaeal transporter family-2 protein [Gaiellaceae bacterium]MDX6542749.1 bacterial/archaeal transporter family-2 protein [Gaiellaceae bacterium]
MTAAYVLISLAAGVAGSIQVAVMGRFGDRIGTLQALAFSTVVTMAIALVVLLIARRSLGGFGDAVRSPPWMWLGGAMGVFIVFTITLVQPRFGTFATVAIFIVAQIGAGVAIDRFGWFGVERVGLEWTRVLGVVLLASGAVLALRR